MTDPTTTADTAAVEPGMFVAPFRQLVHGIHQFGEHWSWRCGVLGALPWEEREAAGCRYDQVTDSWEALIEEASYHLRRYHGIHPEPDPGPTCEHPPFVGGSCLACAERYYAAKLAEVRAAVSSSPLDDTAVEWGARWADGGYCPATPPRSEDFAHKHARNFGTRPIRRQVGPWVYADTGELAFPEQTDRGTAAGEDQL